MRQFLLLLFTMLLISCKENTQDKKVNSIVTNDSIQKTETEITEFEMDFFDPDIINGTWQAETENGIEFDMWLMIVEGKISGQYCAMTMDASKVDCGTDDEISDCFIKGELSQGSESIDVDFVSCMSLKSGKASLSKYGEDQLLWTLKSSEGIYKVDYLAPKKAVMTRVSMEY